MRKLVRIGDPILTEGIVRVPSALVGESGDGVLEVSSRTICVVSAWRVEGSAQLYVSLGLDRMEKGVADRLCGIELFVPVEVFSEESAGVRRADLRGELFS